MRTILLYIKQYFRETDKIVFLLITLFTALLVFCNYHFDIDGLIRKKKSYWIKLFYWFAVFAAAFVTPYLIYWLTRKKNTPVNKDFYLLLFIAPLIFAWKITTSVSLPFLCAETDSHFWNQVSYWPVLAIVVFLILYLMWRLYGREQPLYGLKTGNFAGKPYLLMLIIMIPLITLAATQNDFLAVYPKLNSISTEAEWWQKILFELSYGTDFFTIEFFFRGFLVLGFAKWAGKDAILPMVCFYCTIHFGKPMGECISSYFGGMLLGIVVYNTKSIWGGLLVHLGIAWMMEMAGFIANSLK
jgi:hypothetical protein